MGRDSVKDLNTMGGLREEAFQTGSCQLSSCNLIKRVLSSPTARNLTVQHGSNRFLTRFDALTCWVLRKLIPRHLAKGPPPDRRIYY